MVRTSNTAVRVLYDDKPVLIALSPESAQEFIDRHRAEMRKLFTTNDHPEAAAVRPVAGSGRAERARRT